MDELLKYRDEFPILKKTTYLISNSLGAMPQAVYGQMQAYAESWATRGVRAWEEVWWDRPRSGGAKAGELSGAGAGQVTLHQNVSITQAVIASAFDYTGPRNKIVMVDLEFPSIQYFYMEQRRRGARVELVASEDGIHAPMEKLLEAIDEKTLLVPISLVLFRSATLLDAGAIIERAHRVGAQVILDCYQATGTVPVDVRKLETDFAVGGVLKWLCGGPGVAYLYVRADLQKSFAPTMTGWFAHQRPFAFEVGAVERREDSFGALNGTTHIPALYACGPGLEIVGRVGVERIRQKSQRQTQKLVEGARQRGWKVRTPLVASERGGTVSIDCPHAQEASRELLAREILVDYRPGAGIRMSPHFYNRDEEIDFALEQLEEILTSRAWERHLEAART